MLPDPERHLSKRHCVLAFRAGEWRISDVSANGTFLNRDTAPVGHGGRTLNQGDRLRLGAYEIEVTIEDDADLAAPGGDRGFRAAAYRAPVHTAPPPLDPFGDDPFAPPRAPANPFLEPDDLTPGPHAGGQSVSLGPDFSPIQADREALSGDPIMGDHTPAFSDAFQPPPVTPILPEDWDDDFGLSPKQPAPTPPREAFAPPVVAAVVPPVAAPSPPVAGMTAPVRTSSPASQPDALVAAFLRGADTAVVPADPAAMMESVGAVMRALVAGLRQTLIARAAIKSEFRIEQTMIQARGNNPLKFSADDDDAMLALLGGPRSSTMAPADAVTDALRDIRLHELATIAAIQSAVRTLLAQFDPARLLAEDRGSSVLPGAKRARAFVAFEELYAKVTAALSDDFDSVFGKAFARGYEQALRDAEAHESAA